MATQRLSLATTVLQRVTFSLVTCFLLATLSGVHSADVFFSEDSDETVYYCPTDLDTYRVNLTHRYTIFGKNITHVYFNTPGYLTDTFRPNLATPEKFPKYSESNYTVDCDGDRCWVHYYYSDTDLQEIQDQNYTEDCVHGRPLTSTFDIFPTLEYDRLDDTRLFEPDGCISVGGDEVIQPYNWMIAGYWQDLDAQHINSSMWYRETQDTAILSEAQEAVLALDFVSEFMPTSCVMFTWDRVTYADGFAYGYPQISFQVALVTDSTETYVIYNFNELEFAAGQAGFDAGDTYNYCGLHYSRSNMSHTWTETSNVGIPGRWVMKLGAGYDRSICEPLRADVAYCLCEEGWEGRICASSVDDCIDNNCPADSACVDGHQSYTCDFCVDVTCENEGICANNETAQSYRCDCVGNHTGQHCEQCVDLSCQNGGVCTNNGQSTCTCAEGYSGNACQLSNADFLSDAEETQEDNGLTDGELAAIVVGSVLGVGLLGTLAIVIAKRIKKKDEVEPLPPQSGRNTAMASHA